ncbi:S10 family serine carboxypeptidase-like protein [Methylocystis echinoides]|uniref:S10 family peptidase n=1 Tax=Methylocystis echinoides TaxID=29468 RepID=UPI0034170056
MNSLHTALAALILSMSAFAHPGVAEETPPNRKGPDEQARGLPVESVTNHVVTLQGEKISFTARAGSVRLRDAQTEAPQAEVACISYERAGVDQTTRPILFVFNGGPGAASAWLALGALSPWRLRFSPETVSPSTPPALVENAESWIPFADLVFIDPPGTGFSKILSDSDEVKKRFYSAQGDADALAVVIRKWLTAHGRLASPKFLVGESYGGFRGVKLANSLREHENIGVEGLFLVSPALDFSWLLAGGNPLARAALLPSFAAVARHAKDRADVTDAEAYAAGEYVTDLLKGARDAPALARMSAAVARFTGLDREFVSRLGARIDARSFSRERARDAGRVLSVYDAEISGYDPQPFAPDSDWADPLLESWRAPLGAAMTRLTIEKLGWPIGEARYSVLSSQISHQWRYGDEGRANAEVISGLREALALDPKAKLLVVHGLYDLTTPYFATKLMLDQLPDFGDASRARLIVLKGGHMPYLYEESRKAMRDAAKAWLETR